MAIAEFKNLWAEKNWHALFEFGIVLKGVNGIWESAAGLTILFIGKNTFSRLFLHLTRGELLEDPNDRLINFLAQRLHNLSSNTIIFAAIYILAHGLLNIFLALQLYRQKLWAYLVTIGFMIIFMLYQIYRISYSHSLALTLITIWDILFMIITWHEYKYRKRHAN